VIILIELIPEIVFANNILLTHLFLVSGSLTFIPITRHYYHVTSGAKLRATPSLQHSTKTV
jgi:hypothetical protein